MALRFPNLGRNDPMRRASDFSLGTPVNQPMTAPATMPRSKSMFGGVLDYMGQQNPQTGLSRAEGFAAALDPLVMPSMRSGEAIRQRGAQRMSVSQANKTVEWLRKNGYAELATVVENNPAMAPAVMSQIVGSKVGGTPVRSDKKWLNGTIMQSTDSGVIVRNPQGGVVTGQEAERVIQEANEYELKYNQQLSGGRRLGSISIDAAQDAFQKIALVNNSVTNIDNAVAALDGGAKSGLIYSMIPNVTLASGQLETAMNNMGLDVISSVTFGALSASEMRLAMETAVPRGLAPAELRKYLIAKREAQIKAKEALTKAATYLSNPANSLNTWLSQQANQPDPIIKTGKVKKWNQDLNNGEGGFE